MVTMATGDDAVDERPLEGVLGSRTQQCQPDIGS